MTSKLAQEIVDALNKEIDTGFSDDAGIPKADEIVDRILREHIPSDDVSSLYWELLSQVSNKVPGETRHETALRQLRYANTPQVHGTKSAPEGDDHE